MVGDLCSCLSPAMFDGNVGLANPVLCSVSYMWRDTVMFWNPGQEANVMYTNAVTSSLMTAMEYEHCLPV